MSVKLKGSRLPQKFSNCLFNIKFYGDVAGQETRVRGGSGRPSILNRSKELLYVRIMWNDISKIDSVTPALERPESRVQNMDCKGMDWKGHGEVTRSKYKEAHCRNLIQQKKHQTKDISPTTLRAQIKPQFRSWRIYHSCYFISSLRLFVRNPRT